MSIAGFFKGGGVTLAFQQWQRYSPAEYACLLKKAYKREGGGGHTQPRTSLSMPLSCTLTPQVPRGGGWKSGDS